ncbi:hypothetical protein [Actinomadura rupiterrae]|uniref:hypothetical protein n=1 Tax=Actinomadura rupiterrae TaxID=559627 RepID=UPI0020A5068D|nr:hypothetical protein [Actinomadura rupiterrae]MCP2340918.1 hypothetical protein [Actinomadura rupiterrae]
MDLTSAARKLYGVAPEEFTAARQELVKAARQEGDAALAKQVGALRRPTASAWAVNLLSRESAPELDRLLDTGADLREAWSAGRSIGGLEQRRGELVDLLVRTARRLAAEAGRPLRDPAVREVEDTLHAATVDPDSAEQVREGALTRPLSHSGFVPAGFALAAPVPSEDDQAAAPSKKAASKGATARPAKRSEAASSGRKRAAGADSAPVRNPSAEREKSRVAERREERARERAAAAKRAEEAERRAEKAERLLESREAEADDAYRELDAAETEVERLRADLDAAEHRRDQLRRRAERAEKRRAQAAGAAARARSASDNSG